VDPLSKHKVQPSLRASCCLHYLYQSSHLTPPNTRVQHVASRNTRFTIRRLMIRCIFSATPIMFAFRSRTTSRLRTITARSPFALPSSSSWPTKAAPPRSGRPKTKPLPDGGYYLYSKASGTAGRIRFQQWCDGYDGGDYLKQCALQI
jgi:hypothetical protein